MGEWIRLHNAVTVLNVPLAAQMFSFYVGGLRFHLTGGFEGELDVH